MVAPLHKESNQGKCILKRALLLGDRSTGYPGPQRELIHVLPPSDEPCYTAIQSYFCLLFSDKGTKPFFFFFFSELQLVLTFKCIKLVATSVIWDLNCILLGHIGD